MSTITARIPDELNAALSKVAKVMERPKTFLIYKAVEQYIREAEQDIEDAEIALARMKSPDRKFYSSEEIKEKLEARYRSEHNL